MLMPIRAFACEEVILQIASLLCCPSKTRSTGALARLEACMALILRKQRLSCGLWSANVLVHTQPSDLIHRSLAYAGVRQQQKHCLDVIVSLPGTATTVTGLECCAVCPWWPLTWSFMYASSRPPSPVFAGGAAPYLVHSHSAFGNFLQGWPGNLN